MNLTAYPCCGKLQRFGGESVAGLPWESETMKLAVIGTGYVGLVAGACFAEHGNDVVCVDNDEAKIRKLRRGQDPDLRARPRGTGSAEPDREAPDVHDGAAAWPCAIRRSCSSPSGHLRARTARPTSSTCSEWRVEVARAMNGYTVIVNKSTVPVGTAARVREIVRRETTHPFSVVSNPEFLKQGAAVDDFMKPDRVVIGAEDPRATELMTALYAPFTRTGAPIMVMDCASAELSQVRGQRDAGDPDLVHERGGAGLRAVRRRRGPGSPGRRVGSADRAVIPVPRRRVRRELLPQGRQGDAQVRGRQGLSIPHPGRVEAVNDAQKALLVEKMVAHFGSLKDKTIAVWGLAFKPKTDDMREAPAITIIEKLLGGRGARCRRTIRKRCRSRAGSSAIGSRTASAATTR